MLTKKEMQLLSAHLPPDMLSRLTGKKEDKGMIVARAMISSALYDKAMEGNVYAMDLWLKMNGLINKDSPDTDTELTIRREVIPAQVASTNGAKSAIQGQQGGDQQ